MTMKVLVADELSPEGLQTLCSAPELAVEVRLGLQPAALKALLGQYDVLAIRGATRVTADMLENPGRLKVIGRAGVGVDNVDVEAATRKGVVVMNTPGGNSVAVAELTLGLMLALHRQLVPAITASRSGRWEKKRFAGGHELFRKTVGLVGFGSIGQLVAQRCIGFGTTVIAYDPHPVEASRRLGVQIVPLDELFRRADVVSLHLPLMDNTRHLVSRRLLGAMRKGSYLVNCARGGIVDEAALAEALRDGTLAGAAMDVFATEPVPPDHPLLSLENFICTPHLGASTEEGQLACASQLAEQLVEYAQTGHIRHAVNAPGW
jgi:D-3-phosphoglycerate dehydrogenase/(S)-sulfolactate dehydrogenase